MITALPIEGHALTGRVERANWQERVIALIGDCPPMKGNRTSSVRLKWLLENRSVCPQDADERTVEQYARAYLWYLLTEVVFQTARGIAPYGCISDSWRTGMRGTAGGPPA